MLRRTLFLIMHVMLERYDTWYADGAVFRDALLENLLHREV